MVDGYAKEMLSKNTSPRKRSITPPFGGKLDYVTFLHTIGHHPGAFHEDISYL